MARSSSEMEDQRTTEDTRGGPGACRSWRSEHRVKAEWDAKRTPQPQSLQGQRPAGGVGPAGRGGERVGFLWGPRFSFPRSTAGQMRGALDRDGSGGRGQRAAGKRRVG